MWNAHGKTTLGAMYEVIRGRDSSYHPMARQRRWGGMWEGVVEIVRDQTRTLHICADCHESSDEALMDAVVDALTLASGKELP